MILIKWLVAIAVCLTLSACETAPTTASAGTGSNASDPVVARARAHTELGAAYLQQGKYEIALDEFNQAINILPSYALAYSGLGLVRSSLGQDVEAEAAYKKSIELQPNSSESHNNYGSFLCAHARYDESIHQFLEAVKNPLYSTPNIAYANAGICAARKKDLKNAELYLNKALEIEPLTHSAAYQLADIQFNRGQAAVAKTTLQNALLSEPNAEMLWLAIRIERVLGNRDDEASYALQLRKKFPNSEQSKQLANGN